MATSVQRGAEPWKMTLAGLHTFPENTVQSVFLSLHLKVELKLIFFPNQSVLKERHSALPAGNFFLIKERGWW